MKKEEFITERTRIISEMLDNPDEIGIYPTSKCFEELDALFDKVNQPIQSHAVTFCAEIAYRLINPDSKMDVPSIFYERMEREYDKWLENQ